MRLAEWLGLRSPDVGLARRAAIRSAAAGCAASVVAAGLLLASLALRQPCPAGFVRLLNWTPVALVLASVLATLSGLMLLVQRRSAARRSTEGMATWLTAAACVAIAALALLLCLSSAFLAAVKAHDPASVGCATF